MTLGVTRTGPSNPVLLHRQTWERSVAVSDAQTHTPCPHLATGYVLEAYCNAACFETCRILLCPQNIKSQHRLKPPVTPMTPSHVTAHFASLPQPPPWNAMHRRPHAQQQPVKASPIQPAYMSTTTHAHASALTPSCPCPLPLHPQLPHLPTCSDLGQDLYKAWWRQGPCRCPCCAGGACHAGDGRPG
jgi:hypothetical protein